MGKKVVGRCWPPLWWCSSEPARQQDLQCCPGRSLRVSYRPESPAWICCPWPEWRNCLLNKKITRTASSTGRKTTQRTLPKIKWMSDREIHLIVNKILQIKIQRQNQVSQINRKHKKRMWCDCVVTSSLHELVDISIHATSCSGSKTTTGISTHTPCTQTNTET